VVLSEELSAFFASAISAAPPPAPPRPVPLTPTKSIAKKDENVAPKIKGEHVSLRMAMSNLFHLFPRGWGSWMMDFIYDDHADEAEEDSLTSSSAETIEAAMKIDLGAHISSISVSVIGIEILLFILELLGIIF